MTEFCNVAKRSDLPEGKGRMCPVQGRTVALFNLEGSFYAIDNTCPHRGGPLAEGSLQEGIVTCPWHGFRFDVKTGANPDGMPYQVRLYEVRVQGEDVQVGV